MTKILLVEDDKNLREIYGVRLLAEGYDIVSAGDGEAALAMAIKERPSLIVSDVMMPKISGFDMLDILRSTTETKNIKVIMMTALSGEDQRQRGEQLGADRYLVKSQVGIEDVVQAVHEVLGDTPEVVVPQPTEETATTATQEPQEEQVEAAEPLVIPAPQTAEQLNAQQPVAQTMAAEQQDIPQVQLAEPPAPAQQVAATPPIEQAPQTQPAVTPEPVAPVAPAPQVIQPQAQATPTPPQPSVAPQQSIAKPATQPQPISAPKTGERVIQPLSNPSQDDDFAAKLSQEINSSLSQNS